MSIVPNIPIARKFLLAFGLICLSCIALGVFTFIAFRSIAAKSAAVGADDFPSVVQLTAVRNGINQVRREDLELLLCQTPDCVASVRSIRSQGVATYQEAMKVYQPFISSPEERAYSDKISSNFNQYLEESDR